LAKSSASYVEFR